MLLLLEWSGALLSVFGALLMSGAGSRIRDQLLAYQIWFAASVLMTVFGAVTEQYGIAFNQAIFMVLNLRGLVNRWSAQSQPA